MASKLLLCVSNDLATAAVWRRRKLLSCTRFENDQEGWVAFGKFLRGVRGLPIHIIVDTVEEDFRFETLPHIRGRDRTEMVGRKLKQLYRATPYSSCALQEREAGKRRDDRYLFAALTNPDLLIPWLRAIETEKLPVSGIYPLALVSYTLIDHLKLRQPNLLVISKNNAGLRQTFFKDLKFRISRLTPLGGATNAVDQFYADEISNTRMYLDALTVTHVDDTLELLILDQDGSLSGLPKAITHGRPNVHCQYLDINDIHTHFGIPVADLQASTDTLHLYLLGERAPTLNLAPPFLTRTYQRFAVGRWIYAGSGTALAGAAVWSGVNIFQAMGIDQSSMTTQRQVQEYQAKYQQVTSQFPETPTSADNLRNTVEIAEKISAGRRSPEKMFSIVSRALDSSPDIQLQRLEWRYSDKPVTKAGTSPAAVSSTEPGNFDPAKLLQTGVIFGDVSRFAGDYRAAMDAINTFLQMIARDSAVAEIKVLKLPLDVRSSSALNGSTTGASGKDSVQFEIAVILKSGV